MNKVTEKKVREFITKYPPKWDWDDLRVSRKDFKNILADIDKWMDNVVDMNIDYDSTLEEGLLSCVMAEFELPDKDLDKVRGMISEHGIDHNWKGFYRAIGDIDCLVIMYSNYDCCNSFDNPDEKGTYLSDIWSRIRKGVKREDYVNEFRNGAYGGSLFMFGFSCDLGEYRELKERVKKGYALRIKTGTRFGFHSSFQGSTSPFEGRTYKDITIDLKPECKYDVPEIEADAGQGGYCIADVYGGSLNFDNRIPEVLIEKV